MKRRIGSKVAFDCLYKFYEIFFRILMVYLLKMKLLILDKRLFKIFLVFMVILGR